MRRLSGVVLVLAGAILVLPAFSQSAFASEEQAAAPQAPQKFTFEGDLALWSVAIRPDKTADYEQILAKVKEVLSKSEKPEARRQLAGWKVVKGSVPLNGNTVYTHVITPVLGADYSLLQILFTAITNRAAQEALLEQYKGSFAGNLGVSTGTIVADFSR
jgi:hypothetical protein